MKTKKGGGAEDERRTEATTKTAKKKGDGDEAAAAVVLRMELHCDGCALKVRKAIKGAQGAESVRTDVAAGTVTVAGKADPWDLRDRIQARMARHKPAIDIAFVSPANPPRPPPKPKQQGRRSINKNKDDGAAAKDSKGKGRHDKDGNKQVHGMSSINFVQENCVRSMWM